MNYLTILGKLKEKGAPIQVLLPAVGQIAVTIKKIEEDVVELEGGGNSYFLHYTSVIVAT